MLATIVHRGLTVWIDPVACSARVQVHMPGRPGEHIVIVQPHDAGWTVADEREDEPTWFAAFEQALGEALACGAQALEERLLGELRAARQPRPEGPLATPPHVDPELPRPAGLP